MLTETCVMWQRLIRRSCSLEDTLTRSATFHPLTQTTDHQEEEGSLRQRRITIGESGNIILRTNTIALRNTTDVWLKKLHKFVFLCLPCSIIYASVQGSEWKLPWEGTVNHQRKAFRVASAQPRAATITEYALFIFPSSLDLSKQWLCK